VAPVIGSRSGSDSGDARARDRGQILLIGALALAISLVVLALILNSGIYAHNLASRVDTSEEDAVGFQNEIRAGVGGLVEYSVRNSTNDTAAQTNALDPDDGDGEAGIDEIERRLVRYRAYESTLVNASFEGVSNGTLIRQDTDGDFTNQTGTSDWTLVDDADGVRAFELEVARSSLNASTIGSLSGDTLEIEVSNGSDTWTVYVYENGGATTVAAKSTSPTDTYGPCTDDTGNRTVIDITAGTVGGEHCRALQFFGSLPGSFNSSEQLDVAYENARGGVPGSSSTVNGTYRLVVEKPFADVSGSGYAHYGSGDDPYVAEAVYSVDVAIYYQSPDLTYESTITVAPGEPS